jgi:hypothetical protein
VHFQENLAKQQVTILSHHPYSPVLVPCDVFLSLLERKVMWMLISISQGDCHYHKGSGMGLSCKYILAAFPGAIPILVD